MKAVILCAGDGERMKPLTNETPKPLILINKKPILSYILLSIPQMIEEIYIVIQEKHNTFFENFLSDNFKNLNVKLLFQDKKNCGTYFALLTAKDYLKNEDKFLVLNGDDIFLKKDIEKIISIPSPTYGISFKKLDKRYRTCELDYINNKIISFRKQKDEEYNRKLPSFSGLLTLGKEFFDYEPVFYENSEAGIPHTLFNNHRNVSFVILKEWYQINTLSDLNDIKKVF